MTNSQANKIKKTLRKENAVFTSTAGYYDGEELRVKVTEFLETSTYKGVKVVRVSSEQKEVKTRENIIKVLRALERNGLRPEYRIEQKNTSNQLGTYDCRYVIFK